MDIARVLIRVPSDFYLSESMMVHIDDVDVRLSLREDSFGPFRIEYKKETVLNSSSSTWCSKESWSIPEDNSNEVEDDDGKRGGDRDSTSEVNS